MKKLAIVFIVAVLAPSVALALLAMRSLRDQEIVVQSQLALLHQGHTDSLAADLRVAMDDIRSYFGTLVNELVESHPPALLCTDFDSMVRSRWGQALAGCVVTEEGQWVAPAEDSTEPRVQEFMRANRLFLTNKIVAEVYQPPLPIGNLIQLEAMEDQAAGRMQEANPELIGSAIGRVAQQWDGVAAAETAAETAALAASDIQSGSAPQAGASVKQVDELRVEQPTEAENPAPVRQKVVAIQGKMRTMPQNQSYRLPQPEQNDAQAAQQLEPDPSAPFPRTEPESQSDTATASPAGGARDENAPFLSYANRGETVELKQADRNISPFSQLGANGWEGAAQVAENALAGYDNARPVSSFNASAGEVRDIIGSQTEGALSRFLEDGLHVLLWYRHPAVTSHIFWVELDLAEIRSNLASIVDLSAQSDTDAALSSFASDSEPEVCVALLDAEGHPVAQTVADFTTDWNKPFVASEVGEILPHWEVAAYFLDPSQVASSARAARLTLWMLVPILLSAIGFGSLMIFRDVGREMQAARKKTDFVSNVSHELKTPLTSIRMFSDLLESKQGVEADKVKSYAGIIATEAARLTRLINNLLDFSRMERGEKKYDRVDFDAVALVSEIVGNYRLQIESEGITLVFEDRIGEAVSICGDRDALAQVLLNLLTNAEKYGAAGGRIRVETRRSDDGEWIEICVLDRGPGISRREAARIFEKFYRIDDSLSTGIQGSGLGLTLARQIAHGHGGDIECRGRDDGDSGCCFVLRLPAAGETDDRPDLS